MPVDFTGEPTWRDTVTGPSNTDEATGLSVSDMGVLLADRTMYLYQGRILALGVDAAVVSNYSNVTNSFSQVDSGVQVDFGLDQDANILAWATLAGVVITNAGEMRLAVYDDLGNLVASSLGVVVGFNAEGPHALVGMFPGLAADVYTVKIEARTAAGGGGNEIAVDGNVTLMAIAVGEIADT